MQSYFAVWRSRGTKWDASLPMTEQLLWSEHAEFMNDLTARGFVILGGPLDDGDRILLVIDAESEDAILARLAADPWSGAGLLDIERISPWTIRLGSENLAPGVLPALASS